MDLELSAHMIVFFARTEPPTLLQKNAIGKQVHVSYSPDAIVNPAYLEENMQVPLQDAVSLEQPKI